MAKRIWMIADTHVGCRQNSVLWLNLIESYFYDFFIPLVKREYREGDVLVHLGDVFDNRQSINLAAQHLVIKLFEDLTKIFPEIHVLVGNHDIMKKNSNDITSIDCIKYIPNVNIHKEPKLLDYELGKCFLMPWRRDREHEIETVATIPDDVKYVFCHTETQGVQLGPNNKVLSEHGNVVSVFNKFKRVYSGHIHYRQEKKNFILVGNPYQMTRSDRDNQKGIYVLDLQTDKHTFYENHHSPKFLKYNINQLYERTIEDIRNEIKDNFVDVYISANILGMYNINKFMDLLDGYAYRLDPKIYDSSNENIMLNDNVENQSTDIDLLKIADIYIEKLSYDEELKTKISNTIHELYDNIINTTYEDTEG